MTDTLCPLEERVRAALAQGNLDPELRSHAAVCPVCKEVMAVSDWMRQFRDATLEECAAGARIPDARTIVERARSRRISPRIDADEILKPLKIYRRIALPAGLGAGIILAVLKASSIKALLLSIPGLRTIISGFGSRPAALSPASLGLFGIMAGLGLLTILALAAATRTKQAER